MISDEKIINKIYYIRNQKVMIDKDLAELYGVETRVLNQAVRRNLKRFPGDFMFQMTQKEFKDWISQIVISNAEKMGLRKLPLVFTEQGVAMLSSVLNSNTAIMANIQIIRVFTKMRNIIESHKEILSKLSEFEKKELEQDDQIILIFEYLKNLEQFRQQELDQNKRKRIGYRQEENG
ncbi:MAG: ORF6N domain-containing protein [Bacteroidales bacterium]|nr:ORF6N domain-containing protein [Bacteroidales bacterium]